MSRSTLPRTLTVADFANQAAAILAASCARRGDGATMTAPTGGDGGGGDGGQGGTDSGQQTANQGTQGGDTGQQQTQPTGDQGQQQGSDSLPDDPAALQRMIRDLRRENGTARTNAKQQAADEARAAMAQEIGKALGLIKGDEAPDPAQLTAQLTESQAAARQSAVELAVYRTATKHSANPDALLDSRAFAKAVESLDPAAADFAAAVDTAIKTAVDANPLLKAGRAPGASGADHTGGSGENGAPFRKPTSLHDAVAQSYGART